MIPIAFPPPTFNIRQEANHDEIFDSIRKKWLVLTPEEWVRQNIVNFLIVKCQVPAPLVGLEREVRVGELKRRFDIVVYNSDITPWMLVECKAMDVELSEKTVSQMLAYISGMSCRFAVITNGRETYGWELCGEGGKILDKFPVYSQSQ